MCRVKNQLIICNFTPFITKDLLAANKRKQDLVYKTKKLLSRFSENQKRTICCTNLNEKDTVDNELFWKTVKPLLSNK